MEENGKWHIVTYKKIATGVPDEDRFMLETHCKKFNENEKDDSILYTVEFFPDK